MNRTTTVPQTRSAIYAILVSACALSLGDVLAKASSLPLPIWQLFLVRSVLVIPCLWILARQAGPIELRAPVWAILRSLLLVAMWLAYYAALAFMPFSLAAAAFYTGPVFIVVFSAFLAKRRPSAAALASVGLGFAGCLMILRPGASGLEAATLLPVGAAVLYALAMVLTSLKCRQESALALALALHFGFVVVGTALAMFSSHTAFQLVGTWQSLDADMFRILAVLAILVLTGTVGAAVAYQKGPPATIAAFDYTYLLFSLFWVALFMGDTPSLAALLGTGLIVGAGLIALSSGLRPQEIG